MNKQKIEAILSEIDLFLANQQDETIGMSSEEMIDRITEETKLSFSGIETDESTFQSKLESLLNLTEAQELLALMWLGRGDFDAFKDALLHARGSSVDDFIYHSTEKKEVSGYIRSGLLKQNLD